MPIDYSKWDKLDCSDDDSASPANTPRVTTLEKGTKVTIGRQGLEKKVDDSHYLRAPTGERPSEGSSGALCGQKMSTETADSSKLSASAKIIVKSPGCFQIGHSELTRGHWDKVHDIIWGQTSTTIEIFLRLPSGVWKDRLKKIELLKGVPPASAPSFPCSMLRPPKLSPKAFDEDFAGPMADSEDEEKVFADAYAITLMWDFEGSEKRTDDSRSILFENSTFIGYFPYPIIGADEDAFVYFIEKIDARNFVHIYLNKKHILMGATIWWDRLFNNVEATRAPSHELTNEEKTQFQLNWEEAHRLFLEKRRKKIE